MKTMKLLAAGAAMAIAMPATAATVLYRVDFNVGTDAMAAALTAGGHTVTAISGDLSAQTLSNYALVVYANQNSSQPAGDKGLLDTYLSSGGRVLYTNWLTSGSDLPLLNSAYTGNVNESVVTLSQFGSGSFNLSNPGWGTFSTGLSAIAGGTVAATFGNGDAAIVVGNSNRSIHNGFLNDTGASATLYGNQIEFLLNGSGAVPEPATWMMMILGFGLIGATMRQSRPAVRVRFGTI